MEEGLIVYKASAGSGKTFTLAVEYIKMLVKDPFAYKQILAVTFTNKATAEMKERILGQLYGIWKGDPDSQAYLKRVCEDLNKPEQEVRSQAGTALERMMHDYGRFRIETIDSFFQSVMRNLALELNLSPNLEISLDDSQILGDAVDAMIENLTPRSTMLSWIMQFVEEKIASDKKWNVTDEIKAFGRNLFNEIYIEIGKGLRAKLEDPQYIASYYRDIKALKAQNEDLMKGFLEQFHSLLKENGLEVSDIKYGKDVESFFKKLTQNNFADSNRGTRIVSFMSDAGFWIKKSSPRADEIMELATDELMPLLVTADEFRKEKGRIINSCILSLQQIFKVGLLAGIDEEVREQNHAHNRFLLADTSALLHQLMQDSDATFVFEKIGSSLHNVMIDEFQDTSRLQWDNFKLLLLECLSQGDESLLVGDVKQSIYRWRNGDWTILNGLNNHIDYFPLSVKGLNVNRRSEANIVMFNNNLFSHAAQWYNQRFRETHDTDCEPLLHAYADVQQEVPDPSKEAKGLVSVTFIPKDEEKDYDTLTLEALASEIKELIDNGLEMTDITILIRKNKVIPIIAQYFEKNYPEYRIVSDEAFQLKASIAIQIITDALRLLSNENNKIAKTQLALNYQNRVLLQNLSLNNLLIKNNIDDLLPVDFIEKRKSLALMSLYELVEEIFILFQLDRVEGQDAYLFTYYDAVQEYTTSNSSDIGQFLDYWDEKLCTKTIPSGNVDGIRIMSIHKSKGLEFHTVLIPYCDWSLESETNTQLVWCQADEAPFDKMDIVPMYYSATMENSTYHNSYENEKLQMWVDNLNLLYVAFTRAAKNLIVWCKADNKRQVSEMLGDCLSAMDESFAVDKEIGGTYTFGTLLSSTNEKEKIKTFNNRLEQQPEEIPVKMELYRQKNVEFRQSNRSAEFIDGEEDTQQQYISRGQIMHALFAGIKTENDINGMLRQFVEQGIITTEDEPEIRALTERALSNPLVKDWYDGTCTLFNEREIIEINEGKLEIRRPDRVMLKEDGSITIVDFKFGRDKAEYETQVRGYIDLLQKMGYSKVEGYLWFVYNNRIIKID